MVYNKFVFVASYLILGALTAILLGSCQQSDQDSGEFTVTVDVDGASRVYRYDKRISVGQFLQEIDVTLSELDEVNPLLQTQLRDGMRITVTRVTQREECENEVLPYETERQFTQGLAPGEEQIGQTGENGTVQVCYRITERDGVQAGRVEISRIPIVAPRNEIIWVGSEPPETLIPIVGVLTYISAGQAWIIQGNTANLRPLTTEGFLDGRVFDLSADGRQLLYSIRTEDETDPEFSNELWAILNTGAAVPEAVQLVPSDVRIAQWVSGQPPLTVSYSTANPSTEGAGWRAYNDLYLMQLDPETGEALDVEEVIAANALGTYPWWGRRYLWSSDGTQLAWAMADSVGTVNLETGDYVTLATFAEYAPLLERFQGSTVWVPTLSWSDDGHLITTVHGAPYGEELPENSIIFDLAIIDVERDLQFNPFLIQSGIWASPSYSPVTETPDGGLDYVIAYFQAREPLNSLGAEYDLVVADRDGSNPRVLFPGPERRQGLRPDPENGIVWSPLGRQIALIYQNNLWIVDVETGLAHQITSDGQASRPRWSRTR